jgi:hypothetical protein
MLISVFNKDDIKQQFVLFNLLKQQFFNFCTQKDVKWNQNYMNNAISRTTLAHKMLTESFLLTCEQETHLSCTTPCPSSNTMREPKV